MTLRKLWLMSINDNRIVYSRVFPLPEADACNLGFLPVDAFSDKTVVDCVNRELGLSKYNNENTAQVNCRSINQLPVMKLTDKVGRHLWPVLIVQFKDIFVLGLVSIRSPNSQQVLDEPEISHTLETLQAFIDGFFESLDPKETSVTRSFLTSKLSQIEIFITEKMPFGYQVSNPFVI